MKKELFESWKSETDPRKKARLYSQCVEANRGLVHQAARRFARVADLEDLTQSGYMGVMSALEKFDAAAQGAVRTWQTLWYVHCRHWVRHHVQQAARGAQMVRRPKGSASEFEPLARPADTREGGPLEENLFGTCEIFAERPDLLALTALLSEGEREILVATLADGCSIEEVATSTGQDVDDVADLFLAAWGKVKKCALIH